MAFGSAGNKNMSLICLHLLLLLIFSVSSVHCETLVKTIPGYDGDELPFKLYTGYTTVNGSEMFYYFIESEGDPKTDPLLLWYSGGPGCSAFNGLIYENGPLAFNISGYEGGVPKTYYYPYSWTRTASILFVDAPVGTGFSYATDASEYATSDTKTAAQVYQFLRTWINEHPQYLQVQLFVGADSYAGVSGSIVVSHIMTGNDAGVKPKLNLKGYILGCPKIDADINENSKYSYSHRMGLISDELYYGALFYTLFGLSLKQGTRFYSLLGLFSLKQGTLFHDSAKNSCNSDFYGANVDEPACYEDMQLIARQIEDINTLHILEPKCTWASPVPDGDSTRRSMQEYEYPEDFLRSPLQSPEYCHNFAYALSYVWANDDDVRAALNIRNLTVFDWKRCNQSLDYTFDVTSVLEYHQNLSTKGLQVLIFNGDHDLTIPNTGTEEWIKKLGLTIYDDWRPWLVDGQIAGYTIKYSDNGYRLTYATLKGAGHSPQEYKRREGYMMFDRFIHYYPI